MDGPHTPHRLSLVIPAFNEAAGIRQAVVEADDALARLAVDYEVLVVDDGSTDATAAIVESLQHERPHVRLLRHPLNRGYGAALRTGFAAARFERVAFTDADCQFNLEDLEPLLRLTDEHDVAVGWRIDRKDPWRRRFYSRGYNVLVRALLGTGVRDCDCALKVFRREVVRELLPETNGFFVNAEMLTRARQFEYTIAEAGVRHRPRLRGDSKVCVLDVPRTLRVLMPFWWSRVLFPGAASGAGLPDTSPKRQRRDVPALALRACVLLLVVVAALLCFGRLGTALQEPTEVRYAEAARHLLAGGDNGTLFTWLVASSYRVFGIEDRVARLVPSTAAFLLVLLTWVWGRSAVTPRAALIGAFMLCLSAGPIYFARTLTPDGLTALFAVAGMVTAHAAFKGAGRAWFLSAVCWIAAVLSCGWSGPGVGSALGMLTGVLLGMTPWVLLLPGLVAFLAHRSHRVAVQRPAALGFFLPCALGTALLGLLTGNRGFILAVAPPLALALGCYLDRLLTTPTDAVAWWAWGLRGGRTATAVVLVAGAVVSMAAAGSEAVHPAKALTVAAVALGLAVVVARMPVRLRSHTAWGVCGCLTFVLLLGGLHGVLPGHARRMSLRGQVRPYATLCTDERVPVVCYPRRWDSVEFYLRPADVRVFAADERAALLASLRQQPRTLLVTGPGAPLRDLLRDLPASLEFVPAARSGPVTIGLVRQRPQAPDVLFAYGR